MGNNCSRSRLYRSLPTYDSTEPNLLHKIVAQPRKITVKFSHSTWVLYTAPHKRDPTRLTLHCDRISNPPVRSTFASLEPGTATPDQITANFITTRGREFKIYFSKVANVINKEGNIEGDGIDTVVDYDLRTLAFHFWTHLPEQVYNFKSN